MTEMQLVFFILLVTTLCFLVPRFRSDLVAVCALLALLLSGLISIPDAFGGFSNSVVIMIAALFIVGEGVFQTGLAKKAGRTLVKLTGNSEFKLMIFMMLLVAILSGFISNTGTVAILLPVVVSLSRQMNIHPGKLLMPLAFASSMGGALTLIGTAPNLIASESLFNAGYGALSFFDFAPIGLIILLAGIAFLWFFGRKWLDKPLSKDEGKGATFSGEILLDDYNASPYIHTVMVPAGHITAGQALKELKWPNLYDVTVLEIVRKENGGRIRLSKLNQNQKIISEPSLRLKYDDILIVYAQKEAFERFILETKLVPHTPSTERLNRIDYTHLAEIILTPQSRLINKTVKETAFRENYGLTVLSIQHANLQAEKPRQDDKLIYGDSLLVHGKWEDIDRLSAEKSDTVVLRHAPEETLIKDDPLRLMISGIILLWMLIMMAFEILPAVLTVVIAAVVMILTGCIRQTDQGYRSINWQTVVLIACMLPMATALENSGGVAYMSEGLITLLGSIGPIAVLAGLYILTSAFSQFISNTATAVLLFPVAILTAEQLGVSPIPMVMAVAYSASMAFATPIATPPNAMVMAAGRYTFLDFVRVGVPLQLLIALIAIMILPLVFPF